MVWATGTWSAKDSFSRPLNIDDERCVCPTTTGYAAPTAGHASTTGFQSESLLSHVSGNARAKIAKMGFDAKEALWRKT